MFLKIVTLAEGVSTGLFLAVYCLIFLKKMFVLVSGCK